MKTVLQGELKAHKKRLYNLKRKVLNDFTPQYVVLTRPTVKVKEYEISKIDNLEQFKLDNPDYQEVSKFDKLTRKKRKSLSPEERELKKSQPFSLKVRKIVKYEKFYCFKFNKNSYYLPINLYSKAIEETLDEVILDDLPNYNNTTLLNEETAINIVKDFLNDK